MSKGTKCMLWMLPLKKISFHNSKLAKCHLGPLVVVAKAVVSGNVMQTFHTSDGVHIFGTNISALTMYNIRLEW